MNFVAVTTTSTTPVVTAPIRLITIDVRQPFMRVAALATLREPVPHHPGLRQRERGEHADHVELDQPVEVGVEGDDHDDRAERPGRSRRWRRRAGRRGSGTARGMNRSRARIEASRGKSWYAVFAARTRIAAVNACTT